LYEFHVVKVQKLPFFEESLNPYLSTITVGF